MRELMSQYGSMLTSLGGAVVGIGFGFMTLRLCAPVLGALLRTMM